MTNGPSLLTPETAREWLATGPLTIDEVFEAHLLGPDLPQQFHHLFDQEPLNELSDPRSFFAQFMSRDRFTTEISFAIPCREAVEAIASRGPVVEGGAGTGYWAALLTREGVDIIACDPGHPELRQPTGAFFDVRRETVVETFSQHPERNLLLVWPSPHEEWATEAASMVRPGQYVFLIAEQATCGAPSLYHLIDEAFEIEDRIAIPQWPCMRDRMVVARRL